jgi:RNase H-fold protein (predicted Holliday junction resolvase)
VIFTHPSVPRVQIVSKLTQLVTEKNAHTIVVGLPYDLYGVEKKQLEKTQKFMEKLKNIFPNIKIV